MTQQPSNTPHVIIRPVNIRRQTGDTPQIAAARIMQQCVSRQQFIRACLDFVLINIEYITTGGWTVQGPQTAMDAGKGDCSERALILAAMLKSQGIDARVVWGKLDGILHDTVELHEDKYPRLANETETGHFVKLGEGLHPDETVIGP
jgi:transglutaminase-like putative cysteine protease